MKPKFITFTGIDSKTNFDDLKKLSERYPVEFGVLYSPTNKDNKYTGHILSSHIAVSSYGMKLSAHLCGGYAREVLDTGDCLGVPIEFFDRIQVNAAESAYNNARNRANLRKFKAKYDRPVIMQWRQSFPSVEGVLTRLYDCSGGRGIEAESFPRDPGYFVGFAGGFGPNNIVKQLAKIECKDYYIDMEGKVRTPDNWFDVNLCWAVCESVYSNENSFLPIAR